MLSANYLVCLDWLQGHRKHNPLNKSIFWSFLSTTGVKDRRVSGCSIAGRFKGCRIDCFGVCVERLLECCAVQRLQHRNINVCPFSAGRCKQSVSHKILIHHPDPQQTIVNTTKLKTVLGMLIHTYACVCVLGVKSKDGV